MEKEYIVGLQRGVDYDQFWNEMEFPTSNIPHVPDRVVDIVNNRDVSLRQCHYALSDEEANILRRDPRVLFVEEPTIIPPCITAKQNGIYNEFRKDPPVTGPYKNWGLLRCIHPTNVYGASTSYYDDYTYCLDGTGVDVVILDTGIQANHPEWNDKNGTSRLQQINWYTASGIAGTQPANFYQDTNGHGTHVAGIAVGKTFGWAKNARIYSMRSKSLAGGGDLDPKGLDFPDHYDCIIGWHNAKKASGNTRPTIVNMSFKYRDYFYTSGGSCLNPAANSHNYRGSLWTGTAVDTNKGMVGYVNGGSAAYSSRIASVDINIQEMIDAGIHVVTGAGNDSQKIDILGGQDYDNYVTGSYYYGINYVSYYHRGGSPYDDQAINTGALNTSALFNNGQYNDTRVGFSNTGPGVEIWAPGVNIMSACSNSNDYSANVYNENNTFRQVAMSGTSMAAPQVTGACALLLQANPHMTPAQLKTKLLNAAITGWMDDVGATSYSNTLALLGSAGRILYMPYNVDQGGKISKISITSGLSFKMV